jgi:PPOX class probable F420-dependent enzyme
VYSGCSMLNDTHRALLETGRVARLSTASGTAAPHCVPVCYALDGEHILIALDEKPKSVPVHSLRRVRNIAENPRAAFLLDHYSEDWSRLWFLLVESTAGVCELTPPQLALLRRRYPQYQAMRLSQALCLVPTRVVHWQASDGTADR